MTAPRIRSLSIYPYYFGCRMTLSDQCTNLHSLLVQAPTYMVPFEEEDWNTCEALLRRNLDGLRSLTLRDWCERFRIPCMPMFSPLRTCAQHPNLSTLRMQSGTLSALSLEAFWTICRHLEILELTEMDMSVLTAAAAAAVVRFPKLRELTLDRIKLMPSHQMEKLILHCPMLHTLVWRLQDYSISMSQFCDHLEAQAWPHLDSLEITGQSNIIRVQEYALLLQSAKRPFRFLDLYLEAVDQVSFDLLRKGGHFETLTKVDLSVPLRTPDHQGSMAYKIGVAPSKWIREVLESCPSLEHIAGTTISGQDIIDSQLWVCHRLKKFEVLICMDITKPQTARAVYTEDDKRQCHQVFERLSQLRQLKVLNMGTPFLLGNLNETPVTLPLDLRMGLGHLSTLRDLEWIEYHGTQRMRLVDVEWMLRHWTKLRAVKGEQPTMKISKTFGHTNVRCHLIRDALEAHKVEVPTYWWTYELDVVEYMMNNGLGVVYDTDDDDDDRENRSWLNG
ncbi:hypothetical protein BGX31_000899 [Mortierella sp. GBA43]|nr:hypothetical protein BGX31_000899 [Mortierella sp. GBA43]